MIDAVINWMSDRFGDRVNYRIAEFRLSGNVLFSDRERADLASYDAMACAACQENNQNNHIPEGKQVH